MQGEGLPVVGTVLVAEDDADIREMLWLTLGKHGYRVLLARHGGEAMSLLRSARPTPQVVLLDLNMKMVDGKQFLAEKQADARFMHIPVVIMSAVGEAESLGGASIAGWLVKPVRLSKLLSTLDGFCRPVDKQRLEA